MQIIPSTSKLIEDLPLLLVNLIILSNLMYVVALLDGCSDVNRVHYAECQVNYFCF